MWHIGRRAIIAYLRPFIGLSWDHEVAWHKIRRWKKRYYLPIDRQPNNKPYIDENTFELYWSRFQIRLREVMKRYVP
jgi:hypothetical protein